jgi:nucleoid DNA-binding protein
MQIPYEIIRRTARLAKCTQQEARRTVEAYTLVLLEDLKNNKEVPIANIGQLTLRDNKALEFTTFKVLDLVLREIK